MLASTTGRAHTAKRNDRCGAWATRGPFGHTSPIDHSSYRPKRSLVNVLLLLTLLPHHVVNRRSPCFHARLTPIISPFVLVVQQKTLTPALTAPSHLRPILGRGERSAIHNQVARYGATVVASPTVRTWRMAIWLHLIGSFMPRKYFPSHL